MEPVVSHSVTTNLLHNLICSWTSECISKCNRKDLKPKDIYICPESHRSNKNGNELEKYWKEEMATCWKRNSKPSLLQILFKAYYIEYIPLAVIAFLNYVVMK